MPRHARLLRALTLVLLLALGAPALARAGNAFDKVFANFEKHGGKIAPCELGEATLKASLNEIPNDLQQYASDIQRAIEAALAARASGACVQTKQTGAAGTAPTAPATPPGGGTTAGTQAAGGHPSAHRHLVVRTPPAPPVVSHPPPTAGTGNGFYPAQDVGAHTSAGVPAVLIALGGLVAALALLWLGALAIRALGFEPRWSLGMRHAFGEAGYRTAGVWAEFADWVRLGR